MRKNRTTNTWLIADSHLGHEMLVNRGYRPAAFEDMLLVNLAVIPEHDVFVHLGDVCFGNEAHNHHRLLSAVAANTKILVRGNHDKKSDTWYLQHGWSLVVKELWLERYGRDIILSHEPRYFDFAPWDTLRNVHGHTHGNGHRSVDVNHYYDVKHHVELALEKTNYQPVKLTEKLIG